MKALTVSECHVTAKAFQSGGTAKAILEKIKTCTQPQTQ